MGHHVHKGHIYFAVFFSLVVEMPNIRIRKEKIRLNKRIVEEGKEFVQWAKACQFRSKLYNFMQSAKM